MDSTLAGLLVSSIWLSRAQYEEAESRNEEYIARDHTGLKVEGKGIAEKNVPSEIVGIIGEARSMIEEGLRSTKRDPRVSQLEKENKDLKNRVSELEIFIKSNGLNLPGAAASNQLQNNKQDDDDDDFDPFGSDNEDDEAEAEKEKQEKLKKIAEEKKAKKPALIAKSSIILDIKPWDDETDMKELERNVRNITADGLTWKGSQFKDVAYGIKKLQIICVVEDEKIGTDFLEEEICGLEDYGNFHYFRYLKNGSHLSSGNRENFAT